MLFDALVTFLNILFQLKRLSFLKVLAGKIYVLNISCEIPFLNLKNFVWHTTEAYVQWTVIVTVLNSSSVALCGSKHEEA